MGTCRADRDSVPLHIYSAQASGYDASGCTGTDLQPGASCDVVIQVYPSSEEVGSFVIPFSAATNAANEVPFAQTVNVAEGADAPPSPAPQVPSLPPLALGALALGLGSQAAADCAAFESRHAPNLAT